MLEGIIVNMKYLAALLFGLCLLLSPLQAQAKGGTAYVRLEDEITAKTIAPVREVVQKANQNEADAIIIDINSGGGDIDEGFKLIRDIERSKVPVVCIVDGEADSMASEIFVTCPKRVMTKRSLLMIHQPGYGGNGGQPNDLQNSLDYLWHLQEICIMNYVMHMNVTYDQLQKKIDGGRTWWLDYKEAQAVKAVDIVVDSISDILLKN